ncbi:hypothetical protein BDU57DRAFT_577030 [Ampelomyces quisqualis]|uniref:Cyclase-domain-containing protein n=1 Tax=Ampelomyces quisqualis TaxID=50730 RepID=A0A6A5QMY9_AMPQU|nr:hypothetical protein BDU57DRAFT_577030 [Ampelomyces quisqualis]
MASNIPDFDHLPAVEGMLQGCAWGVFDHDGRKDLRGTLNLLTPEVVAAACKEARDGVSISLKELAYNGIEVTKKALFKSTSKKNQMSTLDHWLERGGLVARSVLIDFKAWYERKAAAESKTYADAICHPIGGHRIIVNDIEAVAEDHNGEVLIIRTGMTEVFEAPIGTRRFREDLQTRQFSGVNGTVAIAKWLWNQHFAAHEEPTVVEGLGELWDLKALSAHCEETGRYSLLFTSCTLNIPGLVGSPPNALAIS